MSVVAGLVIAIASLAGFAAFHNSAQNQERTLLRDEAAQAALYIGSAFGGVGGFLGTLATSNGDPAVFTARAKAIAQGPIDLVLASQRDGSYVVTSAVGKDFHNGQVLDASTSSFLSTAGATASPSQVDYDGHQSSTLFAVGPPLLPAGDVVFLYFTLDPFVRTAVTSAKPFTSLNVAIYGSRTASLSHLLVATVRAKDLPISGDTVTTSATVGKAKWTLVASARVSLVGSFASEAPYIVLGLGLFIALLIAVAVEILDRRQRYASRVADERTVDLQRALTDLRAAQAALVQGERLTALGEMASVVGHELRNPLAAVTNALYLVRRHMGEHPDERVDKNLAMAERETTKAANLAEDLTAFVRPRQPRKEELSVSELVDEVVEATPPPEHVELAVDTEEGLSLRADRDQLAEVLTNLVTNAYQAVSAGGAVRVTARRRHDPSGAELVIEDTGPGIDTAMAERIFEPFFTTKHDGTGLGLAIVRRLVEAHGGAVAFENRHGARGARVVVHLPDDEAVMAS